MSIYDGITGWEKSLLPAEPYFAIVHIGLPLALFALFGGLVYRKLRRLFLPGGVHMETPAEYAGLIIGLSPCRRSGTLELIETTAQTAAAGAALNLAQTAAPPSQDLLNTVGQSNWGPLLAAVRHHAPALAHCWLLCSTGADGSADQFAAAASLVGLLAPAAACHKVEVEDANDLVEVWERIGPIYRRAAALGLAPARIIADLTGGTSAVSGAIALATASEDRDLEYLRQDIRLFDQDAGRCLTREEVIAKKLLVFLRTGPHLVPDNPA